MTDAERDAKILRLYHAEKWRIGTIVTQLGVHRDTVVRVLAEAGAPKATLVRHSHLMKFLPFVDETLQKYPTLPASRLYQMCKERGHAGSPDHFRHFVALHRPPSPAEAYLRLRTLPGEQAQVDWGHFGTLTIGQAVRALLAFVMVLSWSRKIFLRFFLSGSGANFLRGHEGAFRRFDGVPRRILYDNLKSAVIERIGDAIRFNDRLLEFASHYHFEPKPVAIARGNEKGRVERAIGYTRTSFFAGRSFRDIDDLNAQADVWCHDVTDARRCPQDERLTVADAFAQEQLLLLALPDNPFPIDERVEVSVGKTPYVRFDLNDYSVPHTMVRRTLVVRASLEVVRIFDGEILVATHTRSFDRKAQIEDPNHIAALVEEKRHAHSARGLDRLCRAVPHAQELYQRLAQRNANLGSETSRLLLLLDQFGAERLDVAITQALDKDVVHHHAIRQILERERTERGLPPPIPVVLPDDPRVRDLTVKSHDLSRYDTLTDAASNANDDGDARKESVS